MKTKKNIIMLMVLILSISSFSFLVKASQKNEKDCSSENITTGKQISFLSENAEYVENLLKNETHKLDSLAEYLYNHEGIIGIISFGKPISIRNSEGGYYIPVFNDGMCIEIINMGIDEYGNIAMNMSRSFAKEINDLKNGLYYFEYDSDLDITCLKGNNLRILVESNAFCGFEYMDTIEENVISRQCEDEYDFYDNISYTYSRYNAEHMNNNRYAYEECLTISPRFQNGGDPGYCWVCCACEISTYYQASSVGLVQAHNYAHGSVLDPGGHVLYYCPGGNFDDINAIVESYTGLEGDQNLNPLLATGTMNSIMQGKPIVGSWFYGYGTSVQEGHSMVIVGFSYDVSTGEFDYYIHDSNISSNNVVIVSDIDDMSVGYYMNSKWFYWRESLYNWC